MNLSRVVVIVAVTAAIVYAGLNFLLPKHGKAGGEAAVAEAGFGTETAAPAAEPAAASEAAAAEAPAADTSSETPAAETASEAPALSDEEARAIAANVASEAASGDSAATGDAGASGLTDAQRAAIAANVAGEGSDDAAEPTPPPAAAPAPAPVEEVAAAPAPAPAPAAAPKPRKPAAPKPAAAAAPAPAAAPNNGADVITAWWKQGGTSGGLNLVYAGESTKDKAVVLIFDADVDAAAVGGSIKLVDGKGGSPSGSWTNGNNGRVLAFKGVSPGRYTVIVGAGVASTGGKSVGKELVGPVYVR